MDDLRLNVEQSQEMRNISQWKFFIQKNLNNISLDLLNIDKDRTFKVDPKEFVKVIDRRVKVPEYLK